MRKEIYQAYAKYMIEQGKAYPCFCSSDELAKLREHQEQLKIIPGYYGEHAICRKLTTEEAIAKIESWLDSDSGDHDLTRKIRGIVNSPEITDKMNHNREIVENQLKVKGIPTIIIDGKKETGLWKNT